MMTGEGNELTLGNLDAKRDWGYAPEFVRGMRLMLQQDKPDDYVLATGETHTVGEFVDEAFKLAGKPVKFKQDPRLFRPSEVNLLLGDPSKAREKLGWTPRVTFKTLVAIMLDADFQLLDR